MSKLRFNGDPLCAASWTSVQAAQPTVDPVFASDVVDRYANHIYYGPRTAQQK
jgi:hypothetical protein